MIWNARLKNETINYNGRINNIGNYKLYKLNPLTNLFAWKNTILSEIIGVVLFYVFLSYIIYTVHIAKYWGTGFEKYIFTNTINVTIEPVAIIGLAISMLIQFRNNAAYQRFHEGRELMGGIVNASRKYTRSLINLDIQLCNHVVCSNSFIICHLTHFQTIIDSLDSYFRQFSNGKEIKSENSPISQIMILSKNINEDYNYKLRNDNTIVITSKDYLLDLINYQTIENSLNEIIDKIGGSERIIKTPIPATYSILTNRLIHVYLMFLSIALPAIDLHPIIFMPVVAFVTYALVGIYQIGNEIQNPFISDNLNITFNLRDIIIEINKGVERVINVVKHA